MEFDSFGKRLDEMRKENNDRVQEIKMREDLIREEIQNNVEFSKANKDHFEEIFNKVNLRISEQELKE